MKRYQIIDLQDGSRCFPLSEEEVRLLLELAKRFLQGGLDGRTGDSTALPDVQRPHGPIERW